MLEWLKWLVSFKQFMPHGHCYLWNPALVWLMVVSDALIFLSYLSIPFTLVRFISKRKDLPFSSMFALFGIFIIACGTTHAMDIWTLWVPRYWLAGSLKLITAVASVSTAILLMLLIPKALAIPSPQLLRDSNNALSALLKEKEKLLKDVQKMQRQLMDVSRKAGMADVATNMLHSIGNVLNSVNVSADVVANLARHSKVEGLKKMTALLGEQPEPARFLAEDPRGPKMIEYFGLVARALDEDRQQMLEELDSLTKNIDHIKVIVTMQQSHAKSVGVVERLSLSGLLDDAIKFNAVSYDRHSVKTVRDYALVPDIEIDRHKLLEIVMNLLSNARHAVKECDHERRITVRTRSIDPDQVAIEVADNGVGVPAANLEKIFIHGFTTKKEGHGFGLHSSACSAIELGGSLSVHSAGVEQGATFTIVVPRSPQASSQDPEKSPAGPDGTAAPRQLTPRTTP